MHHFNRKPLIAALIGLSLAGQSLAVGALELEEIVVTAQKKAESLEDTPVTVSVITGEQVQDLASFGFTDLSNMSAGLSIAGGGLETDIAMRGIGTDLNGPVNSRVTSYLDGGFVQQDRGMFSGLYDMAQVELLRGPQGTLYAQPSPTGVLTLRSRDPNMEEVDGYLQQTFNDQDGSNTQFGVSLPLIPNVLAVRLSGLYDNNQNSDAENINSGKELESETTAWRVTVLWTPTDEFNARLVYHHIEDEFDSDKVVEGTDPIFGRIDAEDRIAVGDFDSYTSNDTSYVMLEMNYDIMDNLTATLAATYQDNFVRRTIDDDGTSVPKQNQNDVPSLARNHQVELRLASQGNDFWDWNIGGYYMDAPSNTPVNNTTYNILPKGALGPLGAASVSSINPVTGAPNPIITTSTTETLTTAILQNYEWGIFTHNTIHLTERSDLTVGVRYGEYKLNSSQPFIITTTVDLLSGAAQIIDFKQFDAISPENQTIDEESFTGTVKYQYEISDDLMAYGSFDIGYRRPSVNISGSPLPPSVPGQFDAEDSTSFELGFKWKLWENRAAWNMATYYQLYNDFQFQSAMIFRDSTGFRIGSTTPVVNVDEAEVYGFDSDFTVLVSENLTVTTSLSYAHAELTDAKDVPCTDLSRPLPAGPFGFNTCDFTGVRAGNSPEWSFNMTAEYAQPIGSGNSEWYVRGLLNAESEYFSVGEQEDLDAPVTLDLFAGWRSTDGTWDAKVWVKNVADEEAVLNTEALSVVPNYAYNGTTTSLPGTVVFPFSTIPNSEALTDMVWVKRQVNPRTVGVTVSYNF